MIEEILSSQLARKAVETRLAMRGDRPCAANVLRQLVEGIDRLARNCQLTEFTEHGLPHLLSLVRRIDTWTTRKGSGLLSQINNDECFILVFAVLIHDIGMLSQRESDLPGPDRIRFARQFADVSGWVRRTHVPRLEQLTRRLLVHYPDFLASPVFSAVCKLGCSHHYWPEDKEYGRLSALAPGIDGGVPPRMGILGAILAVSDLLDEDSGRCDSMTLLENKVGSLLNRAHWLRHMLTASSLQVQGGTVCVSLQVPSNLKGRIDGALIALKNHLRQCHRYNGILHTLDAAVRIRFSDCIRECEPLPDSGELAMLLCQPNVHLLRTFPDPSDTMPAATPERPQGTTIVRHDYRPGSVTH